jgi:hypothetical protein
MKNTNGKPFLQYLGLYFNHVFDEIIIEPVHSNASVELVQCFL